MKRMTLFAGALVLLLVAGMVGAVSAECEIPADLDPYTDLLAGQDIDVGDVYVWNDAENLCVAYKLNDTAIADGWRITETHLYAGDNVSFPLTKTNEKLGKPYYANPIPGKFPYGNDDLSGVEEYIECIPLSDLDVDCGGELYIAAHAVINNAAQGETKGVIYGTRTSGGDKGLYEIDVFNGVITPLRLFDSTDGLTSSLYSNALAFDPANKILYFTAPFNVLSTSTPCPFWYYDVEDGTLGRPAFTEFEGMVVGASWYNGEYYYIAENNPRLMKIDPTSTDEPTLVFDNLGDSKNFTFGDFAISSEGMLYGSTRVKQQFFSIDLNSVNGDYTVYEGADALDLQLAYGSNGKLYGVRHSTGYFYEVDEATGTQTKLDLEAIGFADLASGELFIFETESAWGAGDRFNVKGNWGTFFIYDLQRWELQETVVVDSKGSVAYSSSFEPDTFKLVAYGTYDYGPAIADAGYSLRPIGLCNIESEAVWKSGNEIASCYGNPLTGVNYLEITLNDADVDWGAYNDEHKYEYELQGSGVFEFRIYDTNYGDNSESLFVDIYQWV